MRDFTAYDTVMARQAASSRRADLMARHGGTIAVRRGRSHWVRVGAAQSPVAATPRVCCAA